MAPAQTVAMLPTLSAPTSTSAGEGTFSRSVRRFDSTTTSPTAAVSSSTRKYIVGLNWRMLYMVAYDADS